VENLHTSPRGRDDTLEKADTAARAIGFYPPESGRDSNGRPFSVDIEDLLNRPESLPMVLDSNPMSCYTGSPA
jgi:hypothetical protein